MSDKKIRVTCEGAACLPLGSIQDFQGNLKELPPENLKKLKKSLIDYGFSFPAFVWRNPNDNQYYNIDGHQRIAALRSLKSEGYNIPLLPVAYINADSESEAREKLLIACSMYGRYNPDGVNEFVENISDPDRVRSVVDLTGIDLDKVLALLDEKCDPEIVPSVSNIPAICRKDDLWLLGEHRLICGDSTDEIVVNRLLNGEKPFIMVTDPPYCVNYQGGVWRQKIDGSNNRKYGSFENDDRADWTDAYKLFPGDVVYVWHAGIHAGIFQSNLEGCGFEIRGQIIWKKQHFCMSRGAFHWGHEPCWYAVRKGANSRWAGDRKQTTVWEIKNSNPFGGSHDQDMETIHSTQKPLECMERPIRLHGDNADIVYEPFAGSGTTIIAAHRQCRRCYAVELSPQYCDIIIQRYANYTGNDPVREDGKKWSEIINAEGNND